MTRKRIVYAWGNWCPCHGVWPEAFPNEHDAQAEAKLVNGCEMKVIEVRIEEVRRGKA